MLHEKKLTKSSRYLFFDLGVRRVLSEEAPKFVSSRKGELFEHFIGNEIIKWIRTSALGAKLYYWRDSDGPEVDWLIEFKGHVLPIEVKLAQKIDKAVEKHLRVFCSEYKNADESWIAYNGDLKYQIEKGSKVVPHTLLFKELEKWKNKK